MKSLSRILLFFLPAMILMTGCNNDSSSENPYEGLFGCFATLTSVSDDGVTFEATPEGPYSSPVTLVASWSGQDTKNFTVGNRYYIYYYNGTTDKPFQPGNIDLYLVANCANGEVKRGPINEIDAMAVGTYSSQYVPTMTGMYVNVFLTSAGNASEFCLMADETTLNNEYPDLYVCIKINGVTAGGGKEYFGSFNVEEVWNNPSAKGIVVHAEVNGIMQSFKFDKVTLSPNS